MMDEEQSRLWIRGGLETELADVTPVVDARTRMYERIRHRQRVRRWSVSVVVPLAVAAVIALVVLVVPALKQQQDSAPTPASTPTAPVTPGIQVPDPVRSAETSTPRPT